MSQCWVPQGWVLHPVSLPELHMDTAWAMCSLQAPFQAWPLFLLLPWGQEGFTGTSPAQGCSSTWVMRWWMPVLLEKGTECSHP